MSAWDTPLQLRVGARTARALAKLGVSTVGELLEYAPRRYWHRGRLSNLAELVPGDDVTVLARVEAIDVVHNRTSPGVRMIVQIGDLTGDQVSCVFFARHEGRLWPIRSKLSIGSAYMFAGRVRAYGEHRELTHPDVEELERDTPQAVEREQGRPIPVYAVRAGVRMWTVARAVRMVLDTLAPGDVPEVVPPAVRRSHSLLPAERAVHLLHRPEVDADWRAARRALAFREALVLQAALLATRARADARPGVACPRTAGDLAERVARRLPFTLTGDQQAAVDRIAADVAGTRPMQRLLVGDVGSGKTVVALLAMAQVVGAGHQAALLAPTEVLADQHARTLRALLGDLCEGQRPALPVRLLTGSVRALARREVVSAAASGAPGLYVGTHALLQESVDFGDLGLVVVDEQHRFGVAQRDKLREGGGRVPHQLVMTATPIPRTIAMTVFGDLDETQMRDMPPGRRRVHTYLVDDSNAAWMARVWQRAREEVDAGHRVFVVCPRIDARDAVPDAEGRDAPPLANVHDVARFLRTSSPLASLGVEELHGRLSGAEKDQVMDDFASGRAPVCVSTTVVEVGVDVPEATLMVILDAQQFGLSQLHQLRGRVGRAARESWCLAVHRHGLSSVSAQRLHAFVTAANGFDLAQEDLRLRSEGDVLGRDQSGRQSGLRFLSVRRDERIIAQARDVARALVAQDPSLEEHPDLADLVRRRSGVDLEWLERS